MKPMIALQSALAMAASIGSGGGGRRLQDGAEPSVFEIPSQAGPLDGSGCVVHRAGPVARATVNTSCSTENEKRINGALALCVRRAQAAKKAVSDGSPLLRKYFMADDDETRDKVVKAFSEIAKGCSNEQDPATRVDCEPQKCNMPNKEGRPNWPDEAGAITYHPENYIKVCGGGFAMRDEVAGGECSETLVDLGDLILHEMSHAVDGTTDHGYGKAEVFSLSAKDALENADSFALLSVDVATGCNGTGGGGAGGMRPRPSNLPRPHHSTVLRPRPSNSPRPNPVIVPGPRPKPSTVLQLRPDNSPRPYPSTVPGQQQHPDNPSGSILVTEPEPVEPLDKPSGSISGIFPEQQRPNKQPGSPSGMPGQPLDDPSGSISDIVPQQQNPNKPQGSVSDMPEQLLDKPSGSIPVKVSEPQRPDDHLIPTVVEVVSNKPNTEPVPEYGTAQQQQNT